VTRNAVGLCSGLRVVVIVEARSGLLECVVGAAETFAGVLLSS
jgi:hypothetical protein